MRDLGKVKIFIVLKLRFLKILVFDCKYLIILIFWLGWCVYDWWDMLLEYVRKCSKFIISLWFFNELDRLD